MIKKITAFILVTALFGCSQPEFNEKAWRSKIESAKVKQLYAEHFKDGKFFNPWLNSGRGGLGDVLTWKFSNSDDYSEAEQNYLPEVLENSIQAIKNHLAQNFIVWIGHDSFLIKTENQIWLLDPMFSKRALLPARVTPPALKATDINKLFPNVNVIISHNHYDHLDEDSIKQLSDQYIFYVPLGLKETLKDWQPKAKIIELDWWDKLEISDNIELHALPAQHWSNRVFDGENTSLWASFMILSPKSNIYFGGDSGYFIGYREFGKIYPKIDYALIPTTAYHPRWFMHEPHMNIDEAIEAFQDLKASYFIPTQWGTFNLGDEPAGFPGLDLKRNIKSKSLDAGQFLFFDIGELRVIN